MSTTNNIASLFKKLTYDEMMDVAERFSGWTGIDEDGNAISPTIDSSTMAANLSDWADEILSETKSLDN